MSIRPRMEEALTVVQSAAVSESRMAGSREPSGTAPGWSQHRPPPARGRTVLIGVLVALGLGLLLVGGGALAWLRFRSSAAHDRTTASQTTSSSVPAPPASSAAVAGNGGTGPASPTLDPAPPVTGQGATATPPEPAPTSRPHSPAARPPAGAAAAHPPVVPAPRPAPPPAGVRPPPPPAPSGNPLTL